MNTRPSPLLNAGDLDALLAWSQEAGAGVSACLQPGLSERQIDELVSPLGVRLAVEARVWWGWHNGAVPEPGSRVVEREPGPDIEFLPLEECVSTSSCAN